MYFFIKTALARSDQEHQTLTELCGLIGALFIAISPWSLQFSRAAFEGGIGVFFLLLALLLLLKGLEKGNYLSFSALSFVAALYSYHSFRLVIPILVLGAIVFFFKELKAQRNHLF